MTTARLPCACGGPHARGTDPIGGVRRECAAKAIRLLRGLQNSAPAELIELCNQFERMGAPGLAMFITGCLPFDALKDTRS